MKTLSPFVTIQNQQVPRFFYGTAWKEERTTDLVVQALQAGFTAIDTANQRKHYFEEAVGNGIKKYLSTRPSKTREQLFLQTKFTFARGQDHRKPYDENDSFTTQVADSFASSLQHLDSTYIDSYVLHGPYANEGLTDADHETWAAMETLFTNKQVRMLGVSNVNAEQLVELYENAKVKPSFVQNRCYAQLAWDKQVRDICLQKNIAYQGFSLLTANARQLTHPVVASLVEKYRKTIPQLVFRFSQQLGMICLTGTSNLEHMAQDLEVYDFELTREEVEQLEYIAL